MKDKYYIGFKGLVSDLFKQPPYSGCGWKIKFEDINIDKLKAQESCLNEEHKEQGWKKYRNLTIEAYDEKTARIVTELIYSCLIVIKAFDFNHEYREEFLSSFPIKLSDFKKLTKNELIREPYLLNHISLGKELQLACIMTENIFFDEKFIYSVLKLAYAFSLLSLPPIDFDPREENLLKTPYTYLERVKFFNIFFLAFGFIEELSLIPVKNKKKTKKGNEEFLSIRNRETGKWDKKSKEDLEKKLLKIGISKNTKFIWMHREGKKSYIYKEFIEKCFENDLFEIHQMNDVNDVEMLVLDAIANFIDFRNLAVAHKISMEGSCKKKKRKAKIVKNLSLYDIVNLLYLGREILLISKMNKYFKFEATDKSI